MTRKTTARRLLVLMLGVLFVVLAVAAAAPADARSGRTLHVPEATRREAIHQLIIVRESIDETLRLIKEGKAEQAFAEAKDGYLSHFEYVEIPLRIVDADLTAEAETQFAEIRGLISSGAPTGQVRDAIIDLRRTIDDAERRLTDQGLGAPSVVATQAFVIIFLEGLEAVLIISVLFGYLESVNATQHRKPILWGVALAAVATVVTFFLLRTALAVLPGGEEVLEALMAMLAVVMLFYVSFWLITRIEQERWMEFLRSRVWAAISAGSTAALMLVGFTLIYREGFETALFFQALLSFGPGLGRWVALGLALGLLALAGAAWAIFRLGRRLPVRGILAAAVIVLMSTSVALIGNAVRELQEVDKVSLHRYPDWPQLPIYLRQSLGYWPSRETVVAQLVLVGIYVAGALYLFVVRPLRRPDSARNRWTGTGHDPTAVLTRRIDAWCFDLLLYLGFMFVILIPLGGEHFLFHGDSSISPIANSDCTTWYESHVGICMTQDILDNIEGNGDVQVTTVEVNLQSVLVLLGPILAYAIFQGIFGASPGKLLFGLRVVRPDGRLAGVGRSVVRTVLWIADAAICGVPILGGMLMIESKGHRRLGDMTASTFVVDRADVGTPIVLEPDPNPAPEPELELSPEEPGRPVESPDGSLPAGVGGGASRAEPAPGPSAG